MPPDVLVNLCSMFRKDVWSVEVIFILMVYAFDAASIQINAAMPVPIFRHSVAYYCRTLRL